VESVPLSVLPEPPEPVAPVVELPLVVLVPVLPFEAEVALVGVLVAVEVSVPPSSSSPLDPQATKNGIA
jgi:hypothetical protein